MKIEKQKDGTFEIDLNLDELHMFGQTLNECCGGFGVKNYEVTMGAPEPVVRRLLDQIVEVYPATLGDDIDEDR
jgi:hypothetical protein